MRISAPIKHYWSQKHDLDFRKLLDSSTYKEDHRLGMLQWSMNHRAENPGYFPSEAIKMANGIILFTRNYKLFDESSFCNLLS